MTDMKDKHMPIAKKITDHCTAHGYDVRITGRRLTDQGTSDELDIPAAAQVTYTEGEQEFTVMVGLSPVDQRMVIHVDTAETIPLARLYVNDGLSYGAEKDGSDSTPGELPRDFGGSQRFLLAERLYRQVNPEPAASLFDSPADVQLVWMKVADEAIAALMEEPANE